MTDKKKEFKTIEVCDHPLDVDLTKEMFKSNEQELFNYLADECDFISLQSNLQEIEIIVLRKLMPDLLKICTDKISQIENKPGRTRLLVDTIDIVAVKEIHNEIIEYYNR